MPTQNLALPFIAPAQAQKHITVNTAFQKLDMVINITVRGANLSDPPEDAEEGERFALSDVPTEAWTGHAGEIAAWQNGIWEFYAAPIGTLIWNEEDQAIYVKQAEDWQKAAAEPSFQNLDLLGVGAAADSTNRLAVSSPASLFNHEGSDHQMKINRQAPADTASLTFQTDFAGSAEIGLAGNDALSFKMRQPDGSWQETLRSEPVQPGIFTPLLRSGIVTIAEDEMAEIPTPTSGGLIAIMMTSTVGFPQSHHSGIFAYDTGGSLGLVTLAKGSGITNKGSVVLTGTTGDVGKTSLSAGTGVIQVENRFGGSWDFTYSFIL
ncbi:DUF2793 domain-containing protein [Litorimonas sp.]|uniref:DUF2793 domain-containing protein n=1 Tax=Litorimonas sp. TaxID=1892381 RepID=UPI003A892DEB